MNLIRHSCDKFEKFGAVVHPCGIVRTKTSALRSILTHPAYSRNHTIYQNILFELLFGVKRFRKFAKFNLFVE